jgi:hypothetical protein
MFSRVASHRRDNEYCKFTRKEDFEAGERHLAINTESLEEHRTIEIRLHHGTVNVKEIYSWVKYLTSLIKGKAYDKKPVAAFRKLSA